MNAVGIDVSKGKSTVAIYRPGDQVILRPRDFRHTQTGINSLIEIIKGLDGETKVCMEHTGRYYEPVATWLSKADIFVSAVNPMLIRADPNVEVLCRVISFLTHVKRRCTHTCKYGYGGFR